MAQGAEVRHYEQHHPACSRVLEPLVRCFEKIDPCQYADCEVELRLGNLGARWQNGVSARQFEEISGHLEAFFGPALAEQTVDYFYTSEGRSLRTRVSEAETVSVHKERLWFTDLQCSLDGMGLVGPGDANAFRLQVSREVPVTVSPGTLVNPERVRIKHTASYNHQNVFRFDVARVREGPSFNQAEQARPRFEVEIELVKQTLDYSYARLLVHLLLKALDFFPPYTTLHLVSQLAEHTS